MKKIVIAAIAASLSHPVMADEMALKRVVLSTAGLAQFTHSGEVEPGAVIDLPVRLDQVDDLLKSLTIFDEDGAIGAVSLPGRAPLAELFRDLPFGPDALNSLPALLNALVGSEVEVEGAVSAKGRLLKVVEETTQLPENGGQMTRHRLTLMTESGLAQAVVEDLASIRFAEAETQANIDKALEGIALNRAKDRRTLAISLVGEKTREAGFSYVVAAPVWKTAYRLVLPKNGDDKARLQGWAVVENLTGNDWSDVELSLVSGNPVALKQPLYTAFFADRPEIPVTVAQRIVPRRDEAGDAMAEPAPSTAPYESARARSMSAKMAPRGVMAASEMMREKAEPVLSQDLGGAAFAAEAEEAATQIAYTFPQKVSLANGSTMMVPFVDRQIAGARSWLYQPETNARHPLASIKLENDTETALPAGIITAFERASDGAANFVGDAQLPLMATGAEKFVTFALDAKTDIRRTDNGVRQTRIGKAIDGVLTLTTKSVHTIDYEITPPDGEDRDIVIDEARSDGWSPAGDTGKIELTAARLRYSVAAPSGQTTKATLRLERTDQQIIRLESLDVAQIRATLLGLETAGPVLQKAIAELGAVIVAINAADQQKSKLEAETASIADDQERIRQNLQAVGQASDLGRQYLDTLRAQEQKLSAIRQELATIDASIEDKRQDAFRIAKTLSL